jgi:hypothetical protein
MIKEILKSRLLFGYIINGKIYKNTWFIGKGLKSFKVDKRSDGWIEIRDNATNEKWAIFKRITFYGALYFGFGLGKKPFVYYIPNSEAKRNISNAVLQIKRKFRFLNVNWTSRGGSKTGQYYHIRTDIIDLFGFINFLKPIPSDVNLIINRIVYPEIKIFRDTVDSNKYYVLTSELLKNNISNFKTKLLNGNAVYGVVLYTKTYKVLVASPYDVRKPKYQVLGGYYQKSNVFNYTDTLKYGVFKNVWNSQSTIILSNIQREPKNILPKPI